MGSQYDNQNMFQFKKAQDMKTVGSENHVNQRINLNMGNTATDQEKADRILRQPRSKMYLDLFEKMDVLSSTDEQIIERLMEGRDEEEIEELKDMTDEEIMAEIRQIFLEEFQELSDNLNDIQLLGVISKCYIEGCDVHAISPEGQILDHFGIDCNMPDELAKGRKVYQDHPSCACVEIYSNCCRVIQNSGEVIIVRDNQ